ncbi:hypothetical protein HHE02_12170 [Helicobacter heilmannii]|uniref:hypothetical protein n=1 Tax=Helicobacter heilmannii TaxID=35817 RepID=UPI0006A1E224|nr:hypothetical protein [Helicobacter heilmannii]CRF47916.1 hypothetical protein HHE02_12170 [Helicobacter heilmannii]
MQLEELKAHLSAGLINPEALNTNPEVLIWVHKEIKELTHDKDVPAYALYDFTLVRAKRYLKIPLEEEDLAIYNDALKAIKQAPLVKDCTQRGKSFLQIDQAGNITEHASTNTDKGFSPLKWCKKRSFEL